MGYTKTVMPQALPDLRIYERAHSIADLYRLAAQSYGDLPAQARRERGRSRPTSSITMAISGRLLRSRNGTALRRQAGCGSAAIATCGAGLDRGFSSTIEGGRGPASVSVYCGSPGISSIRAYFGSMLASRDSSNAPIQ